MCSRRSKEAGKMEQYDEVIANEISRLAALVRGAPWFCNYL